MDRTTAGEIRVAGGCMSGDFKGEIEMGKQPSVLSEASLLLREANARHRKMAAGRSVSVAHFTRTFKPQVVGISGGFSFALW